MNAKNILVMPGTMWSVPLCERIKALGYHILLVDPNSDCPCRKYADEYLQSNIFDWEKVLSFSKINKADAIMSDECDIAMPMISKLGEKLGLSVQSSDIVKYFTDKFLMREFCKEHGLRYPEYRLCKAKEDAIDFFQEIGRPIIIKPLDSNASHGVFKIDSVGDIEKHFDDSLSFSHIEKAVLAERYIEGREFTIDGIKTKARHYTLAISKKAHFKHNSSIANELYFTHCNVEYDYGRLREINDKYVMESGLEYGFTHAEYKYDADEDDYYLIEIACRGGGNLISGCITQYMSGYDTYKYLIDCALGDIGDEDFSLGEEYKDRAAVLKFFETPGEGGIVNTIHGIDYLDGEKDIKSWKLNFGVGDMIKQAKNDSMRIGYYIACCEDENKLKLVMKNAEERFRVDVE